MQSSPYNNPMFAQGLAQLVQGFIGDPNAEAQAQKYASEALLNNQTAQFRDAIGDTGLSGDLASMMIRALQAGPDYSRHAPRIGDAAIEMGQRGYGNAAMAPQPDLMSMFAAAAAPAAPRAPRRAAPSAQPAPQAEPGSDAQEAAQILNQAREALARGASREAVAARLSEMGIDPGGL